MFYHYLFPHIAVIHQNWQLTLDLHEAAGLDVSMHHSILTRMNHICHTRNVTKHAGH